MTWAVLGAFGTVVFVALSFGGLDGAGFMGLVFFAYVFC
jgi:hypothetical protein